MNLSKITKSLLIALPLLALGACSSTGDTSSDSTQSSKSAQADGSVQTGNVENVQFTEQELMVKEYSEAILETTINFDFDKAMIKPEYVKVLDAHAKYLVNNPEKSLTVEGHTDEKGTPEYNIALGERRASAVSTYLENMGVASSQLRVVSYGEEKPVNFSHNADAWAENRRAELTY